MCIRDRSPFAAYSVTCSDDLKYKGMQGVNDLPDWKDIVVEGTYKGYFPCAFNVWDGVPSDARTGQTSVSYTHLQTPQLRADNIDEVLQAMTLREKATLLVGELAANQNAQGTQIGNTERYIPGAAGNTYAIPRLGIPPTVMADGPAGLRIYTKRNYDSHTDVYKRQ